MEKKSKRNAKGFGTVKERVFERKDAASYKRYFARLGGKDGPLREKRQDAFADLEHMRRKGSYLTDSSQTVKQYIENWLDNPTNQRNEKYRTYKQYRMDLLNHVVPEIGHIKLGKLKRSDVQKMVDAVYAKVGNKTTKTGRRFDGAAIARKCRAALSVILNQFIDAQDPDNPYALLWNPCSRIKLPSEKVKPMTPWSPEEVNAFMAVAIESKYFAVIYTALTSGLREGELLALRWHDYSVVDQGDEAIGIFDIKHSLTFVPKVDLELARQNRSLIPLHRQEFLGTPKTKKSLASVTVSSDTVGVLAAHRAKQEEAKKGNYLDLNLIFPTPSGVPIPRRSLLDEYFRTITKAGVPRITFHELRDTHASYLMTHFDISVVSERLRHSTKSTTLNRYVHVLEQRRKLASMSLKNMITAPK